MSVTIFGASLLEEVYEESLNDLFSDLRQVLKPEDRCLLGISEVDRLIDLVRYPLRNALEAQPEDWTSPAPPDHNESPIRHLITHAGHVSSTGRPKPALVEFGQNSSNKGRANLLYHITATSILPKTHGGKEAAVVWLDTENSFSATQLQETCINKLKQSNPLATLPAIQNTAFETLKHVHVFSISSSKQFLSTLDNLPSYLLQTNSNINNPSPTTHHSMHRPLSLIVLSSATAFHWTDRFDTEILRLEGLRTPGSRTITEPTGPPTTSQLLAKLKSLQTKFGACCIYTTNNTTIQQPTPRPTTGPVPPAQINTPARPPRDDNTPSLSQWTIAATLSLTVARVPVPQFASHMSLEECLRDRAQRQEVVSRNRFRVGVSEEWLAGVVRDQRVKDALGRLDAKGAFVMRFGEKGLEIE